MNDLKERLQLSKALLDAIDHRRQEYGDKTFALDIERAVIDRELRDLEAGSPISHRTPEPQPVRLRRRR